MTKIQEKKTMNQAIMDLKTANKQVIKRHRYSCGLASQEYKDAVGCGDFFFESPDGQNGELYNELRKLKWLHSVYKAEYYWKVRKDNIMISYVEGDIYVREINQESDENEEN